MKSFNKKTYSFDKSKAEPIFDVLFVDKQVVLCEGHRIPTTGEIRDQTYSKYHNVYGHNPNNCIHFRDVIHKATQDGHLKFEEKSSTEMGIEYDPFPVNTKYVEPDVPLTVSMVGLKVETDEGFRLDMLELEKD